MNEYLKQYIELQKQFRETKGNPDSVRALYTFKEKLEQSEDKQAKEVLVDVYDLLDFKKDAYELLCQIGNRSDKKTLKRLGTLKEYAENWGNHYALPRPKTPEEKQKEKELAKAKNEANKKMFAMQVIQAVAQTAQNALSAYGSAAAIPVVGYILAPIAAAMAVAAGAIQIAAIKKQQQASEAQGYSQGGFTKPGAVDEPAGIVHAGEWVASQKLLANPVARPMIEALDLAQRTNTIGSLKPEDVSRSIRANDSLARIAEDDNQGALMVAAFAQNSQAVGALVERLNEPFVTVNTVTGAGRILAPDG